MRTSYLIRLNAFSEFINSLPLAENEKKFINQQLYSEDSVSRMKSKNYLPDQRSIDQFNEFMKYLYRKSEELGIDYIKDAIKYACMYINDNNDFLNQFIKFVVITNFDEIELLDNIDSSNKGPMSIFAYLGGLEISHNTNVDYNEEKKEVECEWFHNRAGLQRTKIGSLMMCEFFKKVVSNFPGASITSYNVRRDNESALAFYRKIGFKVVDYNPESPSVGVAMEPQYIWENIRNMEGLYPKIEIDGRIIDYTTYKSTNKKNVM